MIDMSVPRPTIRAVPESSPRPLWSVMIPTYNCARYLRQTLESVLSQDPGRDMMQVEVVDDASTADDPRAVTASVGRGRVDFYQQPHNVGYIRNFETCLQRARGRLVHLLHGDDYVLPGFYERLQRAFESVPPSENPGAAFCRHVYLDDRDSSEALSPLERTDAGVLDGWIERIAAGQRLATPSIVVRRDIYETLGGFDRRLSCAGEDWEMWVRIATRFAVWFEPEPLAVYRVKREGSLTDHSSRTTSLVRDMRLAVEIVEEYLPHYLPPKRAHSLTRYARRTYAGWALQGAEKAVSAGSPLRAVREPLFEAFRCAPSRETVLAGLRIYLQALGRRGRAVPAVAPRPGEGDRP